MVQWNPEILDRNIAPGISSFKVAAIPDLSERFPQAKLWVSNYFLNSVLRGAWQHGMRQVVIAFLRRSSHAYTSYHLARQMTFEYLDGNDPLNPRFGKYYSTIAEWETCVIDITITLDLFKWLNQNQGSFEKKDGSKEYRLYTIGNHIKHVPSVVNSGQCSVNDTVPLWITASGLNSFDNIHVTYEEVSEILFDLCNIANELQDPLTFAQIHKFDGIE